MELVRLEGEIRVRIEIISQCPNQRSETSARHLRKSSVAVDRDCGMREYERRDVGMENNAK
jgi:hypothetical protein